MPGLPSFVTTTDQNHFYSDPVVYDVLHGPGTADEARVVRSVARRHAGHQRALVFLEPACGTARLLRALAAEGHRGIGFDREPGMIEDARARAERAGTAGRLTLFRAEMERFRDAVPAGTPPVDAAFNLINTIRHLPDDASMLRHFAEVAACLTARGVYVVGLSVTDYDLEQPSEDVWAGSRRGLRVTQTVNYLPATPPDRWETVLSHLHLKGPGIDEHRDSVYRLRTYSLAEWADLVERSAVRIEEVLDDAGEPMDPPTMGYGLFVLRPR